jgi:hypothetical protein
LSSFASADCGEVGAPDNGGLPKSGSVDDMTVQYRREMRMAENPPEQVRADSGADGQTDGHQMSATFVWLDQPYRERCIQRPEWLREEQEQERQRR